MRLTKTARKYHVFAQNAKRYPGHFRGFDNFMDIRVGREKLSKRLAHKDGNARPMTGFSDCVNCRGGKDNITNISQLNQQNVVESGNIIHIGVQKSRQEGHVQSNPYAMYMQKCQERVVFFQPQEDFRQQEAQLKKTMILQNDSC